MAIQVLCKSCKKSFQVSEKFAGKQGPCPNCKAIITVPEAQPEVVIHGPEAEPPGKGKYPGAGDFRPIRRSETRFETIPTVIAACGFVLVVVLALVLRGKLLEMPALRVVGLLVVSAPIIVGAYSILRNDELEPYRGLSLWLRSAVCALIYIGLWVGYHFVPGDLLTEAWMWLIVAPPFLIVGGVTAWLTFDLDVENGFLHYICYLLLTLALGWIAHLPMPWQAMAG